MRCDKDTPVTMADGTMLRVDVYRPAGPGPFPVILSAHPYGKDRLPRLRRDRYRPVGQYRTFRHPERIEFSAWTGWEAPDPAFWVPRGYAVVNADLRGFGASQGVGAPFSDKEAQDCCELVEWAGTQPWSTGRVGLDGVSYLAIVQYKVAAMKPAHLAAICPWEGLSDLYRDFARPGGIAESGFMRIWSTGMRHAGRVGIDIRAQQEQRPLIDDWWRSLCPDLERIEVPALVCASFSDHSLHSRGSFEAFRRIGSRHKWLYTHRGGKWSTYYGPRPPRRGPASSTGPQRAGQRPGHHAPRPARDPRPGQRGPCGTPRLRLPAAGDGVAQAVTGRRHRPAHRPAGARCGERRVRRARPGRLLRLGLPGGHCAPRAHGAAPSRRGARR
ncbi:hypothetical protein SSP24_80150 [Streptomyces spinoverrucosus]|uniref:Xaa-Pro dipeptidyl-peptidase-like domain-containing protein n=1 Tax=Streptomyces spinoverrucosus TaxID=284043 RepID=A0A4Y3VXI7_9ACTN|nr:hypothetical protein SSP24_80150 [Streptomyces spinoverrucosus]GHB98497.1 hypothetical protein GCM10010397_83690 [Streptomyces spinoverrucosus]